MKRNTRPEKRRFNSFQRPYSYEQLNAFLKQKGVYDIRLVNEDGRIKFTGEICKDWKEPEIPIRRIRDLTFGQFLDEVDYFRYINRGENNE